MSPLDLGIVAVVILAAGFVKGAFGFGMASIAVPFLALYMDPRAAVLITIVPTVVGDTVGFLSTRKARPDRRAWLYIAACLVAVVPGLMALTWLPAKVIGIGVGTVTCLVAMLRLRGLKLALNERGIMLSAVPAGAVSGLIVGATGQGAPLMASYLSSYSMGREELIGTLNLTFLLLDVVRFSILGVSQVLAPEGLWTQLVIVCAVGLGVAIGTWSRRRARGSGYDRALNLFLVFMGLAVLVRSLTR